MLKKDFKLVKLNITKYLIKKGKQGDECHCPIALAIKQKIKKGYRDSIAVHFGYYQVEEKIFQPTDKIQNFIKKFDTAKKNVSPCVIQLNLPTSCLI